MALPQIHPFRLLSYKNHDPASKTLEWYLSPQDLTDPATKVAGLVTDHPGNRTHNIDNINIQNITHLMYNEHLYQIENILATGPNWIGNQKIAQTILVTTLSECTPWQQQNHK